MHDSVLKMISLGKINHSNQDEFIDLLYELPDPLSLEEAESLFKIFDDDDDDDHYAFTYELIRLLEKVEGVEDSKALQDSEAFWIRVLRFSLGQPY